MSYFTLRFRLQLILCIWLLINYSLIILLIPAIHSPKLAHNILDETEDILQEMNCNKTAQSIASGRINDIEGFQVKDSQIHKYNQYGSEGDSIEDMIRLSLEDGSISELISFSGFGFGSQQNKSSVTSIFRPNSFLKHYQHRSNNNNNGRTSALPSRPRLLSWLPANHLFESTCSFLCYIIVNNLYVLACAYFYWPVVKHNSQIACEYLPTSRSESRQTNKEIDSPQ